MWESTSPGRRSLGFRSARTTSVSSTSGAGRGRRAHGCAMGTHGQRAWKRYVAMGWERIGAGGKQHGNNGAVLASAWGMGRGRHLPAPSPALPTNYTNSTATAPSAEAKGPQAPADLASLLLSAPDNGPRRRLCSLCSIARLLAGQVRRGRPRGRKYDHKQAEQAQKRAAGRDVDYGFSSRSKI